MKKLLSMTLLALLLSPVLLEAEPRRDANGKIIGSIEKVPGGEIIRDAGGKIIERREIKRDGSTIIRDANGKKIGSEKR